MRKLKHKIVRNGQRCAHVEGVNVNLRGFMHNNETRTQYKILLILVMVRVED